MTAGELLSGIDVAGRGQRGPVLCTDAGTFTFEQLEGAALALIETAFAEERKRERERIIGLIAAAHSKFQLDLGPMEGFNLIAQIRETAP